MTKNRSKKNKNNALPLFIEKLIEMLEDQSIDNIISWTTTKDSFNIKNVSQFTQTILPRFFKHNNFSSFIRQLNMYGFKKIRHDDGQNVYENQHFIRGQKQLLKNIKRKINQDRQDKLALYGSNGGAYGSHPNYVNGYNNPNVTLTRQVQQMKNKQKDLEQVCRHLLMQNQKLIQENSNLMKKMKEQSRKKQKKIQQLLIQFITSQQGQKQLQGNNELLSVNGASNQTSQNLKNTSAINNFNMLTLMNEQNSSDLDFVNNGDSQTPLQILSNAISRNKNMKQMKQMFNTLYSGNAANVNANDNDAFNQQKISKYRNRKNKNFTIVQKQKQNIKQSQNLSNENNQNQVQLQIQNQNDSYFNSFQTPSKHLYPEKPLIINQDDQNFNQNYDEILNSNNRDLSRQREIKNQNRYLKENNENQQQLKLNNNNPDPDENSFLSINDFLNIDQNNNVYEDNNKDEDGLQEQQENINI